MAKVEENAVQEAASGLESVEKLIRVLSQSQQQFQSSSSTSKSSMEIEMDCRAVADVAVSKFKRVISLLGQNRTGHARFRRAPLAPLRTKLRRFNLLNPKSIMRRRYSRSYQLTSTTLLVPKNGVVERKDSSKTINFLVFCKFLSCLSLTGDADNKQPSSPSPAAAFQITNLSQVSSAGKPPLSSSSLKRKCSSENLGSGKCGSSSGRCHCSKKSRK